MNKEAEQQKNEIARQRIDNLDIARGVPTRYKTATELNREWDKTVHGQERQLHAARYTYHRQMIHKYGERVRTQQLSLKDAGKMYTMAMDNYDGIIKAAADGASQEANEVDMKAGFVL